MESASRFNLVNGNPDLYEIEQWAEDYFQSLMQTMNHFQSRADLNDILQSLQGARFDQMAAQELAGENPEVITTVIKLVNEKVQRQVAYIKIYLGE